MFCRECGKGINDNAVLCSHCNTRTDEGVNFCQMCGFHTSERTEYCLNCGAKQHNVISQKMKTSRLNDLKKSAKRHRTLMKISRIVSILSIISVALLIVILIVRPEPDNIPEPPPVSQLSPNTFWHDGMLRVGDTYYVDANISNDVVEYWIQGRALLSYIVSGLFVFFVSLIELMIQKRRYKKILKQIKEVQ